MSFSTLIAGMFEKKIILVGVSCLLCFGFLGAHDIWTQEHRWVDIVSMMFQRNDFLHPYLGAVPYYDKPLLTYWLIAGVVSLTQQFNSFTVRLPSAAFALIGLFSAYHIAKECYDKKTAMLFVWMLLSTFFYVFWGRTASADIFNIAGILAAIAIYLVNREQPSFISFLSFFSVIALASLFKGIVAAVIVLMVVGIDVLLRKNIKQYLSLSFVVALFVGVLLFSIPFIMSSYFPDPNFVANKNSGLYLVYKENIVRFFKPFDHEEPFYSYFIYLPLYLCPWIFFFLPAFINRLRAWSKLSLTSRWVLLSFVALFAFFTLSGSRRSYYILPVVPFALLIIVDWLRATPRFIPAAKMLAAWTIIFMLLFFNIMQPYFYHYYGLRSFMQEAITSVPGEPVIKSEIAMFDVRNKIAFYAGLPPTAIYHSRPQLIRMIQQYTKTAAASQSAVALPRLIFTNKDNIAYIQAMLPNIYEKILEPPMLRINGKILIGNKHEVVALIRQV